MRKFLIFAFAAILFVACKNSNAEMSKCENEMLVRIAEIEVGELLRTIDYDYPNLNGSYNRC